MVPETHNGPIGELLGNRLRPGFERPGIGVRELPVPSGGRASLARCEVLPVLAAPTAKPIADRLIWERGVDSLQPQIERVIQCLAFSPGPFPV